MNLERINYEIRYYFTREGKNAAIKFWINSENVFRSNFQKLPAITNSDDLFLEIKKLLDIPLVFIINRTTADGILSKINFDLEMEESKPFLRSLFDLLTTKCQKLDIQISKLDHFKYRERYFFKRKC